MNPVPDAPRIRETPGRELAWAAAVGLLALAPRALYLWAYLDALPYALQPSNDAAMYRDMGLSIYRNGWMAWQEGVFYQAPLYSYFLALLHHAGVHRAGGILNLQVAMGALNAAGVYALARFYLDRRWAAAAAVLFSFSHLSFFFETKTLATTLGLFLWLLFSLAFLAWIAKPSKPLAAAAGALYGLGVLCRPNLLFTLPFLLPFIGREYWLSRRGLGTLAKNPLAALPSAQGLAFLAIALSMMFAVTLRNYAAGGDWVFLCANSGVTLYMGHNARAVGGLAPVEGLSNDIEKQQAQSVEIASRALGRPLKPSESSAYWVRKTMEWIWNHPLEWTVLQARKFLWAFYYSPPAVNYSYHFERVWIPWLSLFAAVTGAVVFAGLAFYPLALMDGSRQTGFLLSQLLGYLLLIQAYYASDRFLTTMIPFLAIAAMAGLSRWKSIPSMRREHRALWLAWTAVVFLAVFNPWFRPHARTEIATGFYNLGVMAEEGSVTAVNPEEYYRQALEYAPNHPTALLNLGTVLARENRLNESNRLFERLLRVHPDHETARNNLAINYRRQGRSEEAAALLDGLTARE